MRVESLHRLTTETMQTAGEMDVETSTAATGGGTGDRENLQIEAGLLPDTMEGAETAQEMQVLRAPHPLHQQQGTGFPNLRGEEGVIESISPKAWKMPFEGDRETVSR